MSELLDSWEDASKRFKFNLSSREIDAVHCFFIDGKCVGLASASNLHASVSLLIDLLGGADEPIVEVQLRSLADAKRAFDEGAA